MKANREDLFRQIEPPPGGAERLSARLAAAPSPRTSLALRLTAAGGVAAVALAAAVQLHERFHPPAPAPGDLSDLSASPEFDRLLGREPRPYELTVSV
ncbi:MAG TPA: hypothetical protein VFV10_08500, partial [Gammaproteobacteria bacterium]|nr:hypothetical protein [Gammaproteobacteria bacterium]